jgi:cytochrome c peroxidase
MFSDFREHVLAVPQLVPADTNNTFDGPGLDQDFGREQLTGDPADRYAFRTSPLRNAAVQAAFMHDGAFRALRDAILHHLDVAASLAWYDPAQEGLPADLTGPAGPSAGMLARLDPLVATPRQMSAEQLDELVSFVENALLDPRARPSSLRHLVPKRVPSGRPALTFQFAH